MNTCALVEKHEFIETISLETNERHMARGKYTIGRRGGREIVEMHTGNS